MMRAGKQTKDGVLCDFSNWWFRADEQEQFIDYSAVVQADYLNCSVIPQQAFVDIDNLTVRFYSKMIREIFSPDRASVRELTEFTSGELGVGYDFYAGRALSPQPL